MSNPLLDQSFNTLPNFPAIRPEHVEPAVESCIALCKKTVKEITEKKTPPSFEEVVLTIDHVEDMLHQAWAPVSHLNSVLSSPELREAYEKCLPLMSAYSTELGQNHELYQVYQALVSPTAPHKLSTHQRKVLSDALLDFKLAGVSLSKKDQEQYKQIQQELSKLSSQYSNNVLDSTDAWSHVEPDLKKLKGIPEHVLEYAKQEHGGYKFSLDFPTYHAVIHYAENAPLREIFYRAYSTRGAASGPHDPKWDNTVLMERILKLRHEKAVLLGYRNYAELSLAKKTAKSTRHVEQFLENLAVSAVPMAKRELQELEAYAGRALQPWDIGFYVEKLRNERFHFSQEELRDYFPVNQVLSGLFELTERLFGITVRENSAVATWHPDVVYCEIVDEKGKKRGGLYLDLYARKNKRSGAWMDDCRVRRKVGNKIQKPVAFLTCNFSGDVDGEGSRLTHDEVETLFHEFGHTLHHLLTKMVYADISGINGVPWDAVELPSQFMENFCWQRDVLDMISCHYQTQKKLPQVLFDRMIASKTFMSGLGLVRQLEFSLFDFRLHRDYNALAPENIQSVLDAVREQVGVVKPPAYNRFQNSFNHVFSGGYAAGYYSYLWAEVLSADAFSRFEEEGVLNPVVGRAFLMHILEKGGSQDPLKLFKKFRGRKENIQALLRHRGLVEADV